MASFSGEKMNLIIKMIIVVFLSLKLWANDAEVKTYTVKQTLTAIEVPYYKDMANEMVMIRSYCDKFNSNTLPFLRFFINNYPLASYEFSGAIYLLGFLGQAADVQLLDDLIMQRLIEKDEPVNKRTWTALGVAFGAMIARNIEGAETTAIKYLTADFWRPIIETKKLRIGPFFDSMFAERLYGFSMKPSLVPYLTKEQSLGKYSQRILTPKRIVEMSGLGSGEYQHSVATKIPPKNFDTYGGDKIPEKEFIEIMDKKYLARKDFYDKILNQDVSIGAKLVKLDSSAIIPEVQPITEPNVETDTVILKNNIDKNNFIDTTFSAAEYNLNVLFAEAQAEFMAYVNNSAKMSFDEVGGRLLDDGFPLSAKGAKFDAIKGELAKDFATEKQILAEIKKLKIKEYLNPTVEIKMALLTPRLRLLTDNELSTINLPNSTNQKVEKTPDAAEIVNNVPILIESEAEVKLQQIIIVTFEIPNTVSITKKYLPAGRGKPTATTITSDDNLRVYMKKINDQWYWNPFGW